MFSRRVPPPHRFQIGQQVGLKTPQGVIPAQIIQGTYSRKGWVYNVLLLNGTRRQIQWPEYATYTVAPPAPPVAKYNPGDRVMTSSYGSGLVLRSTFNNSSREFKYKLKLDTGGTPNLLERHLIRKNNRKPQNYNFNTKNKYLVDGKLVTLGNSKNIAGYKYYIVNYGNGKKEDVISNRITPISSLNANKVIPNGSRVSVKIGDRNRTGILKNGSGRGMNAKWNLVFNNNKHQVTVSQINKVLRYAPRSAVFNQFGR